MERYQVLRITYDRTGDTVRTNSEGIFPLLTDAWVVRDLFARHAPNLPGGNLVTKWEINRL